MTITTRLDVLTAEARQAEQQSDWRAALGHWENIRIRFPDDPAGPLGVGIALQHLDHLLQADTVLGDAVCRFPTHLFLLIEYARAALRLQDWNAALQRWNIIRTEHPENPEGPAGAAVALQMLSQYDAADAVLVPAFSRFADHVPTAVEYARVPMRRNDWDQALERWQQVAARFPNEPEAIAGQGTSLQLLGRLAEAEICLADGLRRFPAHAGIAIEHARIAHRQADWPEAYRRWRHVMAQFPDDSNGYTGAVVALQLQGHHAELESLLTDALRRFPNHLGLAADYARAAHDRGEWTISRRRWEAALRQFPDNQAIRDGLNSASFQEALAAVDQAVPGTATPPPRRQPSGRISELPPSDIMMQFEGLGSGCEFGLVQRHFGAEPLGLLRWGAIPALSLVRALNARFDGLGDPKHTELFEFGDSREFFFRDTLYMFEMHTFVSIEAADYDRVFAQQIRRAAFLKDKLLDDLDGDPRQSKIFVYKQHAGRLPDSEALALTHAIRSYGDHALLCVRPADVTCPDGTIEQASHGLLIGYIKGLSPTNHEPDINFTSWLALCSEVLRRWKGERPSATKDN